MPVGSVNNYVSQQINNPFQNRGEDQLRTERDDQQRNKTDTRPSGTQAAESQSAETRNNGSNRGNGLQQAADTGHQEESSTPRRQERGSLLDISI